jgi:GTP-binding protein HflX
MRFHDTTLKVLEELGALDKPVITILNKIDAVEDPETFERLDRDFPDAIRTSSLTGEGMPELLKACSHVLADRVARRQYRIPQKRGDILHLLHTDAKVLSTDYEQNDILVSAVVPAAIAGRLESFLIPA